MFKDDFGFFPRVGYVSSLEFNMFSSPQGSSLGGKKSCPGPLGLERWTKLSCQTVDPEVVAKMDEAPFWSGGADDWVVFWWLFMNHIKIPRRVVYQLCVYCIYLYRDYNIFIYYNMYIYLFVCTPCGYMYKYMIHLNIRIHIKGVDGVVVVALFFLH